MIVGPFADAEFDGMPDEFETANGFDPNNPADADEDALLREGVSPCVACSGEACLHHRRG